MTAVSSPRRAQPHGLPIPIPIKKTDPKASLSLTKGSLKASIVPSGVYGGHGAIFAAENPIFQSKNRFLAVFAPGNLKDFSKNW